MVDQYLPGGCNIGPAEIARRVRVGHVGVAATALLAVILWALDAARPWRLTLALPAGMAAAGYLQARFRFCFDFGFRGVYNFDARGHEQPVTTAQAQAEDRRRSLRISAASAGIGLGVAVVAMLVSPRRRALRD